MTATLGYAVQSCCSLRHSSVNTVSLMTWHNVWYGATSVLTHSTLVGRKVKLYLNCCVTYELLLPSSPWFLSVPWHFSCHGNKGVPPQWVQGDLPVRECCLWRVPHLLTMWTWIMDFPFLSLSLSFLSIIFFSHTHSVNVILSDVYSIYGNTYILLSIWSCVNVSLILFNRLTKLVSFNRLIVSVSDLAEKGA